MMQHLIRSNKKARRQRRRRGRGDGSGRGTYSGKGIKGQKSRSGKGPRPGFEGGQLPLIKRLPERRGFTNIFKKNYALVKVSDLQDIEMEGQITPEVMLEMRIVKNLKLPVKVLGNGELTRNVSVLAHKFTGSARQKIESAGGVAEVMPS
jgi:large subunit ribosomal protein L15